MHSVFVLVLYKLVHGHSMITTIVHLHEIICYSIRWYATPFITNQVGCIVHPACMHVNIATNGGLIAEPQQQSLRPNKTHVSFRLVLVTQPSQ